jgi:hypothetical protein
LGRTSTQTRVNLGKPVEGYLVLWKKAQDDATATDVHPPTATSS